MERKPNAIAFGLASNTIAWFENALDQSQFRTGNGSGMEPEIKDWAHAVAATRLSRAYLSASGFFRSVMLGDWPQRSALSWMYSFISSGTSSS